MKNGWEYKKLGSLCKTGAGGTPLKSKKENYQDGTIPWLRSGEVNNRNIMDCEMRISEIGLLNSSAKLFPPRTVLIAMYGATAGQVGILNFECSTNQAVCGILPNENFIPEFLYYKFLEGQDDLIKQAVGGAQPNISQEKIKNTLIPNISLPEQKQIVAILDEAFAAIDQAKANIEKNIQNAKELFQSKLNDIFSQKGDGSANGSEKWEEKRLGDVINVIGGGTPSKKNEAYYNGDILWATVRDMNFDSLSETDHKITEIGLKKSSANIIPKNNVIIATRVGLGKVCILEQDTAINQDLKGLIPIDKYTILNKFIFWWYKSISNKIIAAGTGATVQGVKLPFIKDLIFPLTDIKEQERVVDTLNKISIEINLLEKQYLKKYNDLEELKKSLLQKAFAGELTGKEEMTKN